jgi:hypothetical protein
MASGKLEGCREVMATDIQICGIANMAVVRRDARSSRARWTDPCMDAAKKAPSAARVDRSRREFARGYRCLRGGRLPLLRAGGEICETFDQMTLCGATCASRTGGCSTDLTKCSRAWRTARSAPLEPRDWPAIFWGRLPLSETGRLQLCPLRRYLQRSVLSTPRQIRASTDVSKILQRQHQFYGSVMRLLHTNAAEAFALALGGLNPGSRQRYRRTLVRWRIPGKTSAWSQTPALAFADNTLVYTSFADRTVVSRQSRWSSPHTEPTWILSSSDSQGAPTRKPNPTTVISANTLLFRL